MSWSVCRGLMVSGLFVVMVMVCLSWFVMSWSDVVVCLFRWSAFVCGL